MNNFYNNMLPEKRSAWRNAYEIEVAALEHEKRRIQMVDGGFSVEPQEQISKGGKSGWATVLEAPMRLLAILIG